MTERPNVSDPIDRSAGKSASDLRARVGACRICADRFAATKTAHTPRPVPWFEATARVLVAGQAPGMRVHQSGVPFDDPSGDRLRDWLGIDRAMFYDRSRIAVVPQAFCFPGYSAKGADLPPPPVCAKTWGAEVRAALPDVEITLVVGGAAMRNYLGDTGTVTETVANWRAFAPRIFPLPHPSWRNTAWLKRHPWFEADLLPELRQQVEKVLYG